MDPIAFRVLGLEIRWYGILIAVSLLIGLLVSYLLAKYRGQKEEEILNFAPFAIILSIIGARLLHVAVNWSYYINHPALIFSFRSGGLAIHGVILGGFIALLLFVKIRKLDLWLWADILVPALILGQAIGRWGNYFNQEAFGRPTSLPWGIYIDPAHRPYGYASYEYFHPTFFYESVINFSLFFLLLVMHRFYKNKPNRLPPGLIFSMYLGVYAVYRTFIESYRIDSSYIGTVKVVYIINIVALAAALFISGFLIRKFKEEKKLET
ncbi:MAG: prolipoprotein diacylglyceryl transferase [Actinomycetota bacterium]